MVVTLHFAQDFIRCSFVLVITTSNLLGEFTRSISVHNPFNVSGNDYQDIHAYITITNFMTKNWS